MRRVDDAPRSLVSEPLKLEPGGHDPRRRRRVTVPAWRAALLVLLVVGCGGGSKGPKDQGYDIDAHGIPKLVNSVYLDLTQTGAGGAPLINRISKFRSSAGHDYSDSYECCRSMKHYFVGPTSATRIYAPVTGVVAWRDASGGADINIASDEQPAFVFTVMHPVLDRTFIVGEHLTEGEPIGYHVDDFTWSDIVVSVDDGKGIAKTCGEGPSGRLVSYFDTMTDEAFQVFVDRGVATRAKLIISRDERDTDPPVCVGSSFDGSWTDSIAVFVDF